MAQFVVNIYALRITGIGERVGKAVNFKNVELDAIDILSKSFLNLKNRVEDIYVKKERGWEPTRQAIYLNAYKQELTKGSFCGIVEVGSKGAFDLLRGRDGKGYPLGDNQYSMRNFFFRLEVPPDSKLGFLVVQRRDSHSGKTAMYQTIRRIFHRADRTAHFELITDNDEFEKYLTGRAYSVRATFTPRSIGESRQAVQKSKFLDSALSAKKKEAFDINMKVDRKMTTQLKNAIKKWMTTSDGERPQIVSLPVDDDPDKIVLCVETDDGRTKQLHPGMVEDMALSVELKGVLPSAAMPGYDLDSASAKAAELCAEHRAALTS